MRNGYAEVNRVLMDQQSKCNTYALLEQQWQQERKQFECLRQDNQRQNLQILELKQEIESCEEANQLLQNQSEIKDKKILELQKLLVESEEKVVLLSGEVTEMQRQFEVAEDEFLEMNGKIDDLESQNKNLQTEVGELLKKKEDFEIQIGDLRTDKQFLQRYVDEMVTCR